MDTFPHPLVHNSFAIPHPRKVVAGQYCTHHILSFYRNVANFQYHRDLLYSQAFKGSPCEKVD